MSKKIVARALFCAVTVALIGFAASLLLRNSAHESVVQAAGGLNPQPINMSAFPVPAATINGWISSNDENSIRAHGWDLWAGISSITPQTAGWPVWETWYTDTEVAGGPPTAKANMKFRALRDAGKPAQPFHVPRQFRHQFMKNRFAPALAALDTGSQVVGFNKFNLDYSQFVWSNKYNNAGTLWNIQTNWPTSTPVANRIIKPFPATAIGLKPTFQIVHGPNNQSGITVLNYWLGDLTTGPQNSTNPAHPTWSTWKQCVVVNAGSGPVPPNLTCPNGGKPSGTVPVTQFFNLPLSAAEAADICSTVVGQPDLQQCPVKTGDFAILVAMHMTSREDDNWTWQTFWWNYNQPFPYGAPPSSVAAPFNNYAMCTGYSMTVNPPNSSQGANVICYNPYLETGLGVNGVGSNCMSCHGVASYGNNPNNPTYPPFTTGTTAYIAVTVPQDDVTYYDCQTTTDFSWFLAGSIALADNNPPKQPACTAATQAAK